MSDDPSELRSMGLVGWVGQDEFDGSWGIKSGHTKDGWVPLVAKDSHLDRLVNLRTQLHEQADTFGKPIFLARFRFEQTLLLVHPWTDTPFDPPAGRQ